MMWNMVLRRIGLGLVLIWVVSVLIFALTQVLPGDAAEIRLGQQATEANLKALRAQLGLDQPWYIQYFTWSGNLLQGDLDQLVLDEIGLAIQFGYLEETDVMQALEQRPASMDVIITGPAIPPGVVGLADQVTELRRGF